MPKKKEKFYYIRSKSKNYQYGVFDYSQEGYEKAEKYIKNLKKNKKEEFYISEK